MADGGPMMSVGIVCASISRAAGGILPIMQAHARGLIALGATVKAYGIADEFTYADLPTWQPTATEAFVPQFARVGYSAGMRRALAGASHELLHQHGLWLYPSIAVCRWRKQTGRPVVISSQGMLEPWSLANSRFKKRVAAAMFERSNLSGAACIHCSIAEAEGIRAFGLKNPIAVIPNGADLPNLNRTIPRPTWMPDDGRRTLLFLGRLHPKKGINETLQAWALLKSKWPHITASWRLVIAGWNDRGNADGLAIRAQSLGLDDVLFPGPVFGADKDAAFAHSDAFILASYSEGLPMAILEAWSHALPVFMTRHCNLSEGFSAGSAIEVTTDPETLARCLGEHLSSPKLRDIGMRGRDLVAARFSWSGISRELLAVYRWIRGQGDLPGCVRLD